MKLKDILSEIEYKLYSDNSNSDETEISEIIYDSRKCKEGVLFVCLNGAKADGHLFANDAYEKGVRVFLCERKLELPSDSVQCIVASTRIALARVSAAFFSHPERKLKIIGITGTKGKTTVASLIHCALSNSGKKAILIGTAGVVDVFGNRTASKNTTPESHELSKLFAKAVEDGAEYAVMEVSSQAYLTYRVESIHFNIGVFTNLSQDHIGMGEHPDFENYKYCKSRLFANADISVLNSDDEAYNYMRLSSKGTVYTYGMMNADYTADNIDLWKNETEIGTSFELMHRNESYIVKIKMPGEFSVYNALAAAAVCDIIGLEKSDIASGVEKALVPGRFECVKALPYCTMIIDYAHNELSLRTALRTLKAFKPKRLVCLFGSVGERSQIRREGLGKAGGEYADFCILTSDNPDKENPSDIIADIELGVKQTACEYVKIPDRKEAIEYAVNNARAGDIIIFAGKGHEDYQLINGVREHFSERDIINKASLALLEKA